MLALAQDDQISKWRDPSGTVVVTELPLHEDWVAAASPTSRRRRVRVCRSSSDSGRGSFRTARPSSRPRTRCTWPPCPGPSRKRSRWPATRPRRTSEPGHDPLPFDPDWMSLMRVAIAGAGAVGRSIARELVRSKHHVMLLERKLEHVEPDVIPEADGCTRTRVSSASSSRATRDVRRRHRCDRRRQGQHRGESAREDGVRGAPRGRPRQRSAQRVAVRRILGRGRGGVDAAHARLAGRGSRDGGRPGASDDVPSGTANLVEITLPDDTAACRGSRCARSSSRAMRRW